MRQYAHLPSLEVALIINLPPTPVPWVFLAYNASAHILAKHLHLVALCIAEKMLEILQIK